MVRESMSVDNKARLLSDIELNIGESIGYIAAQIGDEAADAQLGRYRGQKTSSREL